MQPTLPIETTPGVIFGVDPGNHGGICALKGGKIVLLERPPLKKKLYRAAEYDLAKMAGFIKKFKDQNPVAYIENVHAMPNQGVTSMFNFGKNFGIWIGLFSAYDIPIVLVTPYKWKKALLPKTDHRTKQDSIDRVYEIFPDAHLYPGRARKPHDGLAEALLIAFYGGKELWR